MLKFFFWILLFANAALFAYGQGYLDDVVPSGHEPGRLREQLHADRIGPVAVTATTTAAPPAAPAAAKSEPPACAEIGNFSAEEAKRFNASLAPLALGDRLSQHGVEEVLRHMVYIPPQADREAADRKAGELRRLGITDFYIIQDNSSLRWAISLGVFKSEEAARNHLAELNRQGVRSARIGERAITAKAVAFRIKEWDASMKEQMEKAGVDFGKHEVRECGAT